MAEFCFENKKVPKLTDKLPTLKQEGINLVAYLQRGEALSIVIFSSQQNVQKIQVPLLTGALLLLKQPSISE